MFCKAIEFTENNKCTRFLAILPLIIQIFSDSVYLKLIIRMDNPLPEQPSDTQCSDN